MLDRGKRSIPHRHGDGWNISGWRLKDGPPVPGSVPFQSFSTDISEGSLDRPGLVFIPGGVAEILRSGGRRAFVFVSSTADIN